MPSAALSATALLPPAVAHAASPRVHIDEPGRSQASGKRHHIGSSPKPAVVPHSLPPSRHVLHVVLPRRTPPLPVCRSPCRAGAEQRRHTPSSTVPVSLRLPCRFAVVPFGASHITAQLAALPPSGGSCPRCASVPLGRRSRAPSTLRASMGQACLAVAVGPHAGHVATVQVGRVPLCASGPPGIRPVGLKFFFIFLNRIELLQSCRICVNLYSS
jgi:hypothetical protein